MGGAGKGQSVTLHTYGMVNTVNCPRLDLIVSIISNPIPIVTNTLMKIDVCSVSGVRL